MYTIISRLKRVESILESLELRRYRGDFITNLPDDLNSEIVSYLDEEDLILHLYDPDSVFKPIIMENPVLKKKINNYFQTRTTTYVLAVYNKDQALSDSYMDKSTKERIQKYKSLPPTFEPILYVILSNVMKRELRRDATYRDLENYENLNSNIKREVHKELVKRAMHRFIKRAPPNFKTKIQSLQKLGLDIDLFDGFFDIMDSKYEVKYSDALDEIIDSNILEIYEDALDREIPLIDPSELVNDRS